MGENVGVNRQFPWPVQKGNKQPLCSNRRFIWPARGERDAVQFGNAALSPTFYEFPNAANLPQIIPHGGKQNKMGGGRNLLSISHIGDPFRDTALTLCLFYISFCWLVLKKCSAALICDNALKNAHHLHRQLKESRLGLAGFCFVFVVFVLWFRMPGEPLFVKRDDDLWAFDVGFLGTH